MRQESQITLIFEHSSLKSGFQHLYCANKFYPHLKKVLYHMNWKG